VRKVISYIVLTFVLLLWIYWLAQTKWRPTRKNYTEVRAAAMTNQVPTVMSFLDKEQPMTYYVATLVERLHYIHWYACQLKVAGDRMRSSYGHFGGIPRKRPKSGCAT
jgi:hypothetical protein